MALPFCGAGEVLLDGENIKNLKLEWLRSQIGLVTQEPALLSLSIRDNIAYGRDATSDQIEEAAKIAHAHTFVSSLEKGYETQVKCVAIFYIKGFTLFPVLNKIRFIPCFHDCLTLPCMQGQSQMIKK